MTDPSRHDARSPEPGASTEFHVAPPFAALLAHAGIGDLTALFALGADADLHKPGLPAGRTRARIELTDASGQTHVFYRKCFAAHRAPTGFPRWRRDARDTACREVRQMDALAAAGIPAVRWAAWGRECAPGGAEQRSALLSPAVPGDALERRLQALLHALPAPQRRHLIRRLSDALAQLVARLHAAGLVHRDLYISHVFVDLPAAADPVLTLIDLQRVFRPRLFRTRWIVKDLAALNYSAPPALIHTTDRLRWLRTYLDQRRLDARARRLVRRIQRKSAQIARHVRRRRERHAS